MSRELLLPTVALAGLLFIIGWLYAPGIANGTFLFDDFANLPALGKYGEIIDHERLIAYLTSGIAGPTGRPVSLLSFLIDARNWPADAAPFLRTNVLLHLLNTALLFALQRALALRLGMSRSKATLAALVGSAAWALHPLWVSTVLYAVQRMAMLATTFVLLGLLALLWGHRQLVTSPFRGAAWIVLSAVPLTLLAGLSKENGLLLPVLALTVIATVLAQHTERLPDDARRVWRGLVTVFYAIPAACLLLYLVVEIPDFAARIDRIREFTLAERVLTQGRMLVEYLSWLLIPRPVSTGLFQDGVEISTGLWEPWTTVPAWLIVLASLVIGWALRRRAPAFALAVLFFFAGHLMESTVAPLELRFEHRSYLPATMLFFPLAVAAVNAGRPRITTAVVAGVIVVIAFMTHLRVDLWSSPLERALTWAKISPESARAQASAALEIRDHGQPRLAMQHLQRQREKFPASTMIQLNYLALSCMTGSLDPNALDGAVYALSHDKRAEPLTYKILGRLIDQTGDGTCGTMRLEDIARLATAARENPAIERSGGQTQSLKMLEAKLSLALRDPDRATRQMADAILSYPSPDALLTAGATLASHGYYTRAITLLDACREDAWQRERDKPIKRLHYAWLDHMTYYEREYAHLRRQLLTDLRRATGSAVESSSAHEDAASISHSSSCKDLAASAGPLRRRGLLSRSTLETIPAAEGELIRETQ